MDLQLNLFFIIISILTIIYIIRKIRKHKLNIDDSIVWIIWSIILLILSIFPKISIFFAKQMGFQSTSNFILCLFVFVSYIMLFFQNIKISELKEKNKEIIQKTSIYVYNKRNNENKEKEYFITGDEQMRA